MINSAQATVLGKELSELGGKRVFMLPVRAERGRRGWYLGLIRVLPLFCMIVGVANPLWPRELTSEGPKVQGPSSLPGDRHVFSETLLVALQNVCRASRWCLPCTVVFLLFFLALLSSMWLVLVTRSWIQEAWAQSAFVNNTRGPSICLLFLLCKCGHAIGEHMIPWVYVVKNNYPFPRKMQALIVFS